MKPAQVARLSVGVLALLFAALAAAAGFSRSALATRLFSARHAAASAESRLPEGLDVIFLHSSMRCVTCEQIERSARQAFEGVAAGNRVRPRSLHWIAINYETPGNTHYVDDFGIATASVVLAEVRDGKPAWYRNLVRAWSLAADGAALSAYIEEEIRRAQAVGAAVGKGAGDSVGEGRAE